MFEVQDTLLQIISEIQTNLWIGDRLYWKLWEKWTSVKSKLGRIALSETGKDRDQSDIIGS